MTATPGPDDRPTGGIRRLRRPSPVARLSAAGWRVAELGEVTDPAGFHTAIAAALGFPAHYGANLDALWDCLADLDGPTALLWTGWQALADADPPWWGRLSDLLTDRADEQPALLVLLQPGSGRPHS